MKSRGFHWMLSLGLVTGVLGARGGENLRFGVSLAEAQTPSSSGEDDGLHPIKTRVGRAVTSTMDKIDNPWFVVSQILVPLCALLFSLMYVRRYRARHAVESLNPGTTGKNVVKNEGNGRPGESGEPEKEPSQASTEGKVQQ